MSGTVLVLAIGFVSDLFAYTCMMCTVEPLYKGYPPEMPTLSKWLLSMYINTFLNVQSLKRAPLYSGHFGFTPTVAFGEGRFTVQCVHVLCNFICECTYLVICDFKLTFISMCVSLSVCTVSLNKVRPYRRYTL